MARSFGAEVSEWVVFSNFGYSYCIDRACELVLDLALFAINGTPLHVKKNETMVLSNYCDKIKRINKDMKLILYSPGIWVIHIRRTYSQYDRNAKQTNDNL